MSIEGDTSNRRAPEERNVYSIFRNYRKNPHGCQLISIMS